MANDGNGQGVGMAIRWERLVEVAQEIGRDPTLAVLGDRELEAEVVGHAVRATAITARLVITIAELVVRGLWADQGAKTPGQWLAWRLGMAPSTAREHVRVGLALRGLPEVRQRFLEGTLSYSKVRAITRVADEASEELLLGLADASTAADLERMVRRARTCARSEGMEPDPLACQDPTDGVDANARVEDVQLVRLDGGVVEVRVRLDEADGQRALAQLSWLADEGEGIDRSIPVGARRAMALLAAVGAAAASGPRDGSGEDRDRLVVEARIVEAVPDPTGGPGASAEAPLARSRRLVPRVNGRRPVMSARTLERLACTASLTTVVTDESGRPLDIGRSRRAPTASQRRQLVRRDGGCRFPACQTVVGLHAHHAVEWSDDGPTDLDNLVLLCHFHHRFVHSAAWKVVPRGGGSFAFLDQQGREVVAGASAEARAVATKDASPTPPDPTDHRSLSPPWYVDEPIDWELCLLVLMQAFEERLALAA